MERKKGARKRKKKKEKKKENKKILKRGDFLYLFIQVRENAALFEQVVSKFPPYYYIYIIHIKKKYIYIYIYIKEVNKQNKKK